MSISGKASKALAIMIMMTMLFSLSFTESFAASGSITLKKYNVPGVVYMGHSYSIKGKIKAKKKITKVDIGIVNASTGKWKYKYTKSKVNRKSFNIKKADSKLKFGKLKEGNYYYRIKVKLKGKKTKTVLNRSFAVVDNSADSSSLSAVNNSGVKLSGVRAPEDYTVGKEFIPKGVVSADSKIKKVEVGIVFEPTNKWTEYKYEASNHSDSFDLSKAAGKLKFNMLPGGTFRYRMYLHTENGVKLAFNKKFTVTPSAKPQQAVNWAVNIANDNTFSYGKKPKTSKVGCYFCGTNQKNKPKGYEKTYVCSTFVHAAFAHGANDPEMLKNCQSGKYCISQTDSNFKNYSCWFKLGLAKDLKVSDLQPGDVIVYYAANNYSGHMCIYVGGNTIVDSEGIKDCWGPNSIATIDKAAAMLVSAAKVSGKSYVMRYRK